MPDPLWQNSLTYDAHELRTADAMMTMSNGTGRGGRQGVRPGTGLITSISGTTLTVSTGNAFVSAPTGEGSYRATLDTAWTQIVTAADATFTRIDLVYFRVWDTDLDGLGLRQALPVYLVGTPSGSPVAPSIPAGLYAFALATVTVPPSGGGSATVSTSVLPYTVAPGGILPVSSSADIAASGLYVGQARYNTVRGCPEYWTGSAWQAQGDWTAYTSEWTAAGTDPVKHSGTLAARYSMVGRTCTVKIELNTASDTTFGSGQFAWSLPIPASSTGTSSMGACHGITPGERWDLQALIASGPQTVLNVLTPSGSDDCRQVFLGSAQGMGGVPWDTNQATRIQIAYEI